jgi:uncharacterized protein HemX
VRLASRTAISLALVAALAAPSAQAAPTVSTATPTVPTQRPTAPAFGPVQGLANEPAQTETTVTNTKRAGDTGNGRGTLLFLSFLAIAMIFAVAGFIWYEGRKRSSTERRRRQRMRSGRTPQIAGASSGEGRRGPPPPPRKRRAQAKRKKR